MDCSIRYNGTGEWCTVHKRYWYSCVADLTARAEAAEKALVDFKLASDAAWNQIAKERDAAREALRELSDWTDRFISEASFKLYGADTRKAWSAVAEKVRRALEGGG